MKKLGIVVVGPGLIGSQHIRLINENSDCELRAIVAPDHAPNHSIAEAQGVPLFHQIETCLAASDSDGVIVSSPNQFHAEQAAVCIEAGIAVLVEKPITATVAEGEALAALVEIHKGKLLVGHHRAHSPLLARAREIIKEGRLGRLVSVMGSAQFHKPPAYFEAGPWRTRPGGGPILINLIHEIGNLRSLCGEIVAVQALASSEVRGFMVEDTVAINLRFESGVLGNFMLSDAAACARSWEQTSHENPSFPAYDDEDCYVIAGTRGYLSVPTFRVKLHPEGVEPSWLVPFEESLLEVVREEPLGCQLAHFVSLIRGEVTPLVSAADGLRNLKVTEAIVRSAAEGRVIHV